MKQANRIYLFCMQTLLDLTTGQAFHKLDCAVVLVYVASMGWLLLDVSSNIDMFLCSLSRLHLTVSVRLPNSVFLPEYP